MLDSKGLHAGCAFVQYTKWAACEAAIEALHDKHAMDGCDHALVVKFADAKRAEAPFIAHAKRGSSGSSCGGSGTASPQMPAMLRGGYMRGHQYAHHPGVYGASPGRGGGYGMAPSHHDGHGGGHGHHHQMVHHPGGPYLQSMPFGGLPGVPGLVQASLRGQSQYGSAFSVRRGLSSNDGGSSDSLVEHSGSDASEANRSGGMRNFSGTLAGYSPRVM